MKPILQDYLAQYKPRIDAELMAELARRKQEVLQIAPQLVEIIVAMEELAAGGKKLRGILTLLGYELAGKTVDDEIVRAAVAMEIFHLALLIQDDVMDRDSLRRGVKTIHTRYSDLHLGESLAVLASDYCNGYVIDILSSLNLPARTVLGGMAVWGKYFQRVSYGQTLDVWTDSRNSATEDEIMQVLSLKSGEYSCVLPLLLGATLGGGNSEILRKLEKFGMEMGWVFQLRDDYLAEYGDSSKTGKPVGNDRREGKKSLLLMYGKTKAEEVIAEHLSKGRTLTTDERLIAILEYMAERDQ